MGIRFVTFHELFKVECKKCGSNDVDIYPQDCSECGMTIEAICNKCKSGFNYHDFKTIEEKNKEQ